MRAGRPAHRVAAFGQGWSLGGPWYRRLIELSVGSRGDESVYAGVLAGGPDTQRERDGAPDYREALSNHLRRSHERGLATLLHYGDAISMAHSIESRLPFLDHRLVEFVFSLPGEYKLRDGRGKALLREAVRGDVPDSILSDRPKLGFVVPIREWFRSQPDATVLPVLLSAQCRERGLFNSEGAGTRLAATYRREGGLEQPDLPLADA